MSLTPQSLRKPLRINLGAVALRIALTGKTGGIDSSDDARRSLRVLKPKYPRDSLDAIVDC
jgi:hypothetical protein